MKKTPFSQPRTHRMCTRLHTSDVYEVNLKLTHSFRVQRVSETTSTNSAVLEIAQREKLKSLVLVADHQTEGRGQFGRKWVSKPGENLLFSIYFEPALKPSEASKLTQIACQTVVEVLTDYQIACEIKKPNDILVDGKKICGILTESSSKGEKLEYVVVGIGLNLNSSEETLLPEAVSMKMVSRLGKAQSKNETETYDHKEVLDKILTEFQKQLNRYLSVIPDKTERRVPESKLRFPLTRK